MESPLKAIGFTQVNEKEMMEDILEELLSNPTKQEAIQLSAKQILAEYMKEIAENTYVMARVCVNKSSKEPKIQVFSCDAYVEANTALDVEDVEVEGFDDGDGGDQSYYVVCEERQTAMQIVFWLQNVVEYLEARKKNLTCSQVNIVGIASEGTIVLPIEKDEEEEQMEKEEREKLRLILQQMKNGDEEAKEILEKEEKELDDQLKERLREEDFLSVMSGYFIPETIDEATYAVLGEILEIKERINNQTDEKMYIFSLDVNDLNLEVVISQRELIGMPSVGMRFMGTCWIQGKVIMS